MAPRGKKGGKKGNQKSQTLDVKVKKSEETSPSQRFVRDDESPEIDTDGSFRLRLESVDSKIIQSPEDRPSNDEPSDSEEESPEAKAKLEKSVDKDVAIKLDLEDITSEDDAEENQQELSPEYPPKVTKGVKAASKKVVKSSAPPSEESEEESEEEEGESEEEEEEEERVPPKKINTKASAKINPTKKGKKDPPAEPSTSSDESDSDAVPAPAKTKKGTSKLKVYGKMAEKSPTKSDSAAAAPSKDRGTIQQKVSQLVIDALEIYDERKGVSAVAIRKYVIGNEERGLDWKKLAPKVKIAIEKGIEDDLILRPKGQDVNLTAFQGRFKVNKKVLMKAKSKAAAKVTRDKKAEIITQKKIPAAMAASKGRDPRAVPKKTQKSPKISKAKVTHETFIAPKTKKGSKIDKQAVSNETFIVPKKTQDKKSAKTLAGAKGSAEVAKKDKKPRRKSKSSDHVPVASLKQPKKRAEPTKRSKSADDTPNRRKVKKRN